MNKVGPILTLVMLSLPIAALIASIYLKVVGLIAWGPFVGSLVTCLLLGAFIGSMVWSDIQAKWWKSP